VGDWQSEHEHRYLVHYSDGGAGMRFERELQVGDAHADGGQRYTVTRVEAKQTEGGFGHAWVELRK